MEEKLLLCFSFFLAVTLILHYFDNFCDFVCIRNTLPSKLICLLLYAVSNKLHLTEHGINSMT